MAGPLAGIRVVDCSTGTAGPRATGLLADYGADVTWVQPPGGDRFGDVLAVHYSVFNRAKSTLAIDLRDPAGQRLLDELLTGADVFVESWRPGVADRLGVGYPTLHDRFPSLVYASISGFGQDGPHRDLPGYEPLVHAVVGTMGEQPGVREGPIFEGLPFASIGAGYLGALAIVAALYRRHDDGVGRRVETSLLDGALAYLTMLWGDADVPPPPRDPGSNRLVARNFLCADGQVLGVHTGAVGAFGRLMRLVGLDDRVPSSDTGLDMGIPLTPEERVVVDQELPEIFASAARDVWLERLTTADICAIPLLEPLDVFDEPQVRHNGMVVRVEDPELGPVDQVAPPARFTPVLTTTQPPEPSGVEASGRPLLDGVRVLELGAFYAGPYGSRLLADLGADVIRVETMLGDPNRGHAVIFGNSHAGMRSVAMDLKAPGARPVTEALLRWADVVHHSMRPGAAERLGVGHDDARALNPSVVYAYAPGWGSSGPDATRQSFAPLMSGYVGATSEVSGAFNPPVYPTGNEDPANGLLGAFAMVAALVHRRATGAGHYVEHPQLNAALTHVAHIVRRPEGEVLGAMRLDPVQLGTGPLERLYETADGWVCVVATSEAELAALAKVLDIDLDLGDDAGALESAIADATATRPTGPLVQELTAAGAPAAEPLGFNAVAFLRDPENHRTGRVAEGAHPTRGTVREIGTLIRASHAASAPHRLAPALGEHNAEVLTALGFSDEVVERLRAEGALV